MYDSSNLSRLAHLRALTPAAMQAFETFDRAAMGAGAIPRRYKELIALACAVTNQCPYSLEVHRTNALNAGVSEGEIAEAIFVAAAMRATATIAHGTHLVGPKK